MLFSQQDREVADPYGLRAPARRQRRASHRSARPKRHWSTIALITEVIIGVPGSCVKISSDRLSVVQLSLSRLTLQAKATATLMPQCEFESCPVHPGPIRTTKDGHLMLL